MNETISFSISKNTKYHGRNLFTVCMIAMTSQPPLFTEHIMNEMLAAAGLKIYC